MTKLDKFVRNTSLIIAGGLIAASGAQAACVGTCGTSGADGVVSLSPLGAYSYITTNGGISGVGSLGIGGEVNGSEFSTSTFTAGSGASLNFYFNYVTSDGAGFSDYAWAQLRSSTGVVATLFSARTTASGDVVPGFGLPALTATLTPVHTPIIDGGPVWSPLGESSGSCFDAGCGYTGWIGAQYTIARAGDYSLVFGVTNNQDESFDTGLAFTGVTIDGTPVPTGGVPEPATWAMMIVGFVMVGSVRRRRTNVLA
ncbi:NF038132 family protein [Glacieibacterium sp.]|uniref:NF038132 family protein n=1 Tax=Glacieibacterium sp. TaxID=2860237 RepID=UPI003B0074C3